MIKVGVNIQRSMQMMAVMNSAWQPQGSLFLITSEAEDGVSERGALGAGNLELLSLSEFESPDEMHFWLMGASDRCDIHAQEHQGIGYLGMMIFVRYSIWPNSFGWSDQLKEDRAGTLLYFLMSPARSIGGQMSVEQRGQRDGNSIWAGSPGPVDPKYIIFPRCWGEIEFSDSF